MSDENLNPPASLNASDFAPMLRAGVGRVMRHRRFERVVVGLAVFAMVWGLYFTSHPVSESVDYICFYRPSFVFLTDSIKAGRLPLWNPYIGLGRPFLADLQSAVLYPPVYLTLLGQKAGLLLIIWLHLLLAVFGMCRLAWSLGAAKVPGYMAAFAFVLCAPITGRLFAGQILYVCGLCYLPWLFWHATRIEEFDVRRLGQYAGLLALQFLCGHPQVFWFSVLGQAAYILVRSVVGAVRESAARLFQSLANYCLAGVWCVLLVAAALLPFCELIKHGNRSHPSMELAAFGSLEWRHFVGLYSTPAVHPPLAWEQQLFIGCVMFLPGLAGLTLLRDRNVRGLVVLVMLSGMLAMGEHSPMFDFFFTWLPGYASLRLHCRDGVLVCLALLLTAAIWLSEDNQRAGSRALCCASSIALIGLVVASFAATPGPSALMSRVVPLVRVPVVAFSLWVFQQGRRTGQNRWVLVLMVLTAGFELISYGLALRVHYSFGRMSQVRPGYQEREQLLVQSLKQRELLKTSAPPPRVLVPQTEMPTNDGMVMGVSHADAYTSLFLARPWDYLHAIANVPPSATRNTFLPREIYDQRLFSDPRLAVQVGWDPQAREFVFGRLARNPGGPSSSTMHESSARLKRCCGH